MLLLVFSTDIASVVAPCLVAANNGTNARTVLYAFGSFTAGYTFPRETRLTALAYNGDMAVLFAYGSAIYQSTSSGLNFTLAYTLTGTETATDLASSVIAGRFSFLTSLNRVLYGQSGARGLVIVPTPLQTPPGGITALLERSLLPAVAFNGLGQLHLVGMHSTRTYPTSASAYPVGTQFVVWQIMNAVFLM